MATKQNISILIKVLDQVSAPFRNIAQGLDNIADKAEKANRRTKTLDNWLKRLEKSAARLGRTSGLMNIAKAVAKARDSVGQMAGKATALGGKLTTIGSGVIYGFKRLFLDPAAEYENFERRMLTAQKGNEAAAKKSSEYVQKFASKVPFHLNSVYDAYIKLQTYGIDPENGALQAVFDQAVKTGGGLKGLQDNVQALGSAWANGKLQNNEAMQLMEQGIPVWDLLSKASGMSAEKLQELASKGMLGRKVIALLIEEMGKDGAGASENKAKGWDGMMTKLTDWWTIFADMVMKSGPFEYLKKRLSEFLEKLEEMQADGSLQALAEEVGKGILEILEGLWEMAKQAWAALNLAKEKLGGWDNVLLLIAGIMAGPLVAALVSATLAVGNLGIALMTTPVGWILLACALIAGAVYLIYKHWGQISTWFDKKLGKVKDAFDKGFIQGIVTLLKEFSPTTLLLEALDGLVQVMFGYDLGAKVKELLLDLSEGFWDLAIWFWEAGGEAVQSLWEGCKEKWTGVKTWFNTKVDAIGELFGRLDLLGAGQKALESLWTGLKNIWANIEVWIGEKASALAKPFVDAAEYMFNAGTDLFQSLWDGAKDLAKQFLEWLSDTGTRIENYIKDMIPDISWPSMPSWIWGGDDDGNVQAKSAASDSMRNPPSPAGATHIMANGGAGAARAQTDHTVTTKVHITADNLPPGMSVSTPASSADETNLDLGYSRAGGGW